MPRDKPSRPLCVHCDLFPGRHPRLCPGWAANSKGSSVRTNRLETGGRDASASSLFHRPVRPSHGAACRGEEKVAGIRIPNASRDEKKRPYSSLCVCVCVCVCGGRTVQAPPYPPGRARPGAREIHACTTCVNGGWELLRVQSGRLHAARVVWFPDCGMIADRGSEVRQRMATLEPKGGKARFNCAGRSVQPMQPVLPVWLLLSTLSIPCSMFVLACWH